MNALVGYALRVRHSLVLSLLAIACGRHDVPPPAPAPSAIAEAPVDAGAEAGDAGANHALAVLVAQDRWPEVAAAIDALGEGERADPRLRFLRARAALGTGHPNEALARTDGLELPALAGAIERLRALAKLDVGPQVDAARFFARQRDVGSQVLAGLAFEKAGDVASARALATKLVDGRHGRRVEARARALRLRLGADADELADEVWLATKGADLPEAKDAGRAKPPPTLAPAQLAERARVLADAGHVDDALAAAAKLPKGLVRDRLRGDVMYRGKRYGDAAKALAACAKQGGAHAAEDAFTAARALSRAERDDDASKAWQAVAKQYRGSPFADESTYMVARGHFLHARWASAVAGFDEYLKRAPAGADRKDALHNGAVARLLAGEAVAARAAFAALARAETDGLRRAQLTNLEALAEQRAGGAKGAAEKWTAVARRQPLSWPALVARARLTAAKEPVPPAIDPPKAGRAPAPPPPVLPAEVRALHELGLGAEAERELSEHEAEVRLAAGPGSVQALCDAYGAIGGGKRRLSLSSSVAAATFDAAPSAANRWAWECSFPRPFAAAVTSVEGEEKLPAGLLYAVMRQESGFDAEVVSPARAVGIMQLLPETAAAVATGLGREHREEWLTRPVYNLTLGAHYLSTLLARFKGQVPLAVAAYNAGPEAVERWSARARDLDIDLFVDTIPYAETRGYVLRVMGNLARYAYLSAGEAGIPAVSLSIQR